ncbi:MAG: hypothetical protein V7K38_18795 [Nostoc sp.]
MRGFANGTFSLRDALAFDERQRKKRLRHRTKVNEAVVMCKVMAVVLIGQP